MFFPKGSLARLAREMARELADPRNADVGVYKPRMNFWLMPPALLYTLALHPIPYRGIAVFAARLLPFEELALLGSSSGVDNAISQAERTL